MITVFAAKDIVCIALEYFAVLEYHPIVVP